MNEEGTGMFSNTKLSTIFVVVLGLHVVVIVFIGAYHLLKGDTSVGTAVNPSQPAVKEYAPEQLTTSDESSPHVDTGRDLHHVSASGSYSEAAPMSMPTADDPVWTGQENTRQSTQDNIQKNAQKNITQNVPVAPYSGETVRTTIPSLSSSAENTSASPLAHASKEYIVRKGDTLSSIASRHQMKVADLQKINALDSSMIRIGQKLKVAGASQVVPHQNATAAPKAAVVTASNTVHVVSQGDTLWGISKKYGTTPQRIMELNAIKDPSRLRIGDSLNVPDQSTRASNTSQNSTDMAMFPNR
ncbi:MAG: LysM peptidoglycan-binding domain-containing protein [Candidatus Methylacidiphilales bacterium]